MSSVEAYRVAVTMGLNISEALAGVRQLVKAYQEVAAAQKSIIAAQSEINTALKASAQAAQGFAEQMERAGRAAREMAGQAAAMGRSGVGAGGPLMLGGPGGQAPLALPYYPRGSDFTLNGAPYGPGTAMVYSGPGRQWDAAGGSRSYDVVPYRGDNSYLTTRQGFTIPPGAGADEPYFNGDEPAVRFPRATRGEWYSLGYGAQMAGNAAGGLVDSSFMAAAGTQQLRGALAQQGFKPDQVSAAYAAAVKTQQEVMGTYVGKNLGLIVQLMALTQDANTSITMLPEMARAQQVFTGLGRNGDTEIAAAMKSAELCGVLFDHDKANIPAIRKFLTNMEGVVGMSGGRYGPSDILQLLKSGGIAASIMTDENGFAEMMPFIQSMGAARAGTALRAFSREFPGGRMSDAAFNTLTEMGVIKHPELAKKIGIGYRQLLPGAIGIGDFQEAMNRPESFVMDRLLPLAQAYDAKNYGPAYKNATDQQKIAFESVTMGQVASMIPGGVFMSEMLRLAPLAQRDVSAFHKQAGTDAYQTAVAGNPLMVLEGYKAAVNALQITLGNDNMKVSIATMKGLTAALNSMSNVFAANPALGAELMGVADALKVIAPTIAFLSIMAPAVASGRRIFGGIASAGAEGAAGAAAGGFLGKLLPGLAIYDFASWGAKNLNPISGIESLWSHLKEDAAKGDVLGVHPLGNAQPITVNLNVDGKTLTSVVLKDINKRATTPETGTGGFDGRRSPTPPGNN